MLTLLLLTLTSVYANLPVVLWHGMGDSCCDENSIGYFKSALESRLDVYVHSVQIGTDVSQDEYAGFFGQIEQQVLSVCDLFQTIPELKGGFNAIGFSQGGLFLRTYAQLCSRGPRINNLITFGSPHNGVADIPGCDSVRSVSCTLSRSVLLNGAYMSFVQYRIIQAQYYRMYTDEKSYLSNNIFLPRINNEGAIKNSSYAENLKRLNRFVLIKFEDDQMIVPKDSAWFDFVNQRNEKLPLKMQGKYLNDELGLKSLDEQGKLVFLTFPGPHMKIDVARFFNEIVPQYLEDGNAKGRLNFELF